MKITYYMDKKKIIIPNAPTKSQIKILNSKCITNQYNIKYTKKQC